MSRDKAHRVRQSQFEIKSFFSSDVPTCNPKDFSPTKLEEIYFPLQMRIGIKGREAADVFQVLVASPEALRTKAKGQACRSGRHILIVFEYSWPEIRKWLQDTVEKCSGRSWEQFAQRLSLHFRWEYEDYER